MWSLVHTESVARLAVVVAFALPQAVLRDLALPTVAQGTQSNITEARQVVVRTAEDWQALWTAHSPRPAPQVDFSRSIVVGVFLGSRPTAGFGVEITAATVQGDEAVVQVLERRPDSGAIQAQVITSPFHLVALPANVLAIRFAMAEPSR